MPLTLWDPPRRAVDRSGVRHAPVEAASGGFNLTTTHHHARGDIRT
ncbi:MAG: hypothetical protein HOV68_01805 [Streptomycetaceae bacterium]|nr:hypothetical protein [Streptomycetaceae bacterium]